MAEKNSKIDAYVAKSADYAKPILTHIRKLVHKTCPEVEESVKWGMPFFEYKRDNLCWMAAFKQHAAFGFWKAALMKDAVLMENSKAETAMGHLGKITSIRDLPSDKKLAAYIKEAMLLNEQGIKVPRAKPKTSTSLKIPGYFLKAIMKNKKAWAVFQKFPPSHVKEYVQWITEAKREETRTSRIEKAVAMMEEGKDRNWKYK